MVRGAEERRPWPCMIHETCCTRSGIKSGERDKGEERGRERRRKRGKGRKRGREREREGERGREREREMAAGSDAKFFSTTKKGTSTACGE